MFKMDEIHLSNRLLQENILRVEKENWELINKEIQREREVNSKKFLKENSEKCMKKKQDLTENQRKCKSSALGRKVTRTGSTASKLVPNSSSNTMLKTPIIQSEKETVKKPTYCDADFDRHEYVKFLNHFQTELQQQKKHQWKCLTHAIPLSQPIQRDMHFGVERLQQRKESNKENDHLCAFVQSRGAKKLSIQKLPSITVEGKNTKAHSNISLETIIVYDENEELKMEAFSKSSAATSSPSSSMRNISAPSFSQRNSNQGMPPPERPTCAEAVDNSEPNLHRKVLSSLLKEILKNTACPSNSQLFSQSSKENECSNIKSTQTSFSEVFGNKENKCVCHASARNNLQTQTEESCTRSNFCQTDNTSLEMLDREFLGNFIHEVVSKHQTDRIRYESNCSVGSLELRKVSETKIPLSNSNTEKCYSSKQTQVSLCIENDDHQSANEKSMESLKKSERVDEKKSEKGSSNVSIEQQLAAITSKVENLMNVMNSNMANKQESYDESQHKTSDRPVHTRDVALQFSPYLINQSVYTSPIRTLDKANQCDDRPQCADVCTQATFAVTIPKETATVSTQSDCSVTKDIWVQTERFGAWLDVHSNDSSVAVTPVSDSPFLDDVLSEGEIPLHLKFLSFHGQGVNSNSTAAESSEYSLSEGEIPPRYFQSWSCSQNAGTQLCTSCSRQQSKPHSEKNIDASAGEINSFYQRQINCSTPVRNTFPHSFENPYQFSSPGQTSSSASKPNSQQMPVESGGEQYRRRFQMQDKTLSPSNLSSLSSLDSSN